MISLDTLLTRLMTLALVTTTVACASDETKDPTNNNGSQCTGTGAVGSKAASLADDIATDTCWTADTVYTINPKADGSYMKVLSGATLTIEAGTTVLGGTGSALIVTRGARIVAEGTAAKPIVFTSAKAAGSRGLGTSGDWGGLLLLGAAPTNWVGNNQLFEALPESDTYGYYGGDNASDDSGVLKYVRIEFAGNEYATGKEFNGLTLCGVGKGTTVDYVQVHRSSDDGVELFGGTVDVKHIVSSQNQDDGFDTDSGWSGRGQFIVVQHLNGQSSDPNGYESDDHPSAFDSLPRTAPTIYNATLVGNPASTKSSFGAILRRGTSGLYYNQIFLNFPTAAIEVRDSQTVAQYPTTLAIQSSIFFTSAVLWRVQTPTDVFDEETNFGGAASNRNVDPAITDASSLTAPSFKPAAGSPALTGAATPPNDGFFDTTATYVGAMGSTDWTAGWTSYPQS